MSCKPLYDDQFLTSSYVDARSVTARHSSLGLAWLDACIDAVHSYSFFDELHHLETPHLLVRRLARKLRWPGYQPRAASKVVAQRLKGAIENDPILRSTTLLPMLTILLPLVDQPFSLFCSHLATTVEDRLRAGEYLSAVLSAVKDLVDGTGAQDTSTTLAHAFVAELFLMGYSRGACEELILRCFDVPRGSTNPSWSFPGARAPEWGLAFSERLDALRELLLGAAFENTFIFTIHGLDLTEENLTLDGCRFYHPSVSTRFTSGQNIANPEEFGHPSPDRVNAEVTVRASNAAIGHHSARRQLTAIIDRLQNLMPLHRSPVVLGDHYLRVEDRYARWTSHLLPHNFTHAATLDHDMKRSYERFYAKLGRYDSREFIQTLWSHAKRARDTHDKAEALLSYWTVLERICDEARVTLVAPDKSILTDFMADILSSTSILHLPITICRIVAQRAVFASRPPYRGPMPTARARLRIRNREVRTAFADCADVERVVSLLPQLRACPMSTGVAEVVDWAISFFELGRHAAGCIAELRERTRFTLSTIYELRNEITHDAIIDTVLLESAHATLEGFVYHWLSALGNDAGNGATAASQTISRLYFAANTLEARLKVGDMSLAKWPTFVLRDHIHARRHPQFDYGQSPWGGEF